MAAAGLPNEVDTRYTTSGVTYGALYALARRLVEQLGGKDEKPFCLVTQDRAIACASVLASLSGGPALVIPHALSPAVLAEARQATGFGFAVGGSPVRLPAGVTWIAPRTAVEQAAPPELSRVEDEPFLALFTGGSTGRPRVWHKTPLNLLGEANHWVARCGFGPEDVFVSSVPPLHIYGLLFSVLIPLLAGSQVVDRPAFLPGEIASMLASKRSSVFVSGPTHYRALRQSRIEAPRLRWAFSSGGMLDPEDGALFAQQTGVGVTEVYGSTETGGVAIRCRRSGEVDWTPLQPVRTQVRHERLCVGSAYLSPELPRDEGGLFVTGDRAEATAEGRFALLGRADGLVKVAGKRVDLLEVEQKLSALDGVRDAHVLATEGPAGRGSEIVALVVGAVSEASLREGLAEQLEAHALPRRILLVESIPTTTAGKRDRQAIEALL